MQDSGDPSESHKNVWVWNRYDIRLEGIINIFILRRLLKKHL